MLIMENRKVQIIPLGILLISIYLLQPTVAKPQQGQSGWIINQRYGDGNTPNSVSFKNVFGAVLRSFLDNPALRKKQEIARCYREDVPTISIRLYYESLCPGCMHYIRSELYPTYQKLGKYRLTIRIY